MLAPSLLQSSGRQWDAMRCLMRGSGSGRRKNTPAMEKQLDPGWEWWGRLFAAIGTRDAAKHFYFVFKKKTHTDTRAEESGIPCVLEVLNEEPQIGLAIKLGMAQWW